MRRKHCVAVILARIGMEIELRIFRLDQQLAGIVVKEKGNVQTFFCDLPPFAGSAFVALLPGSSTVEKARSTRNRGRHRIRSGRNTIDLDEAKGDTADL